MPPRPATIAKPPTTARPASWNPAVPPPPVTGAPLGTGVYEGLGDGLAEGLWLALDVVDGVAEELVLELALSDTDALALADAPALALAEVLAVAVEVALELALGEPLNTVTEEEVPEVQAESATQAIMVVRPQPTAVYRTRCDVHAMAVRTLIEPPHALGNDHFPVAARRNRRRKGKRVAGLWSLTAPAGERTGQKDRRP
jgi:hypothetical protein